MATLEQLQQAFMRAHQAGDTTAARALAAEVQRMQNEAGMSSVLDRSDRVAAQQRADRKTYDPTKGGYPGQTITEGTGRGLASVLRAVGANDLLRRVLPGLPEDRAEAAVTDKPLMDTTGGQVGNVIGTALPALATVPLTPATATAGGTAALATGARMLPGLLRARTLAAPASFVGRAANTAAPQAAAGALTGLALTEGDLGERALAGGLGGVFGAAGSAIPTLYATGKGVAQGLVEPLSSAGRDRVTARLLERFSDNPSRLAGLQGGPTATGANLTMPEAARDVGLATLQRVLGNVEPGTVGAQNTARQRANNAARMTALEELAGRGGKRDFYLAERAGNTNPLYDAADTQGFNLAAMTDDDRAYVASLAERLKAAGVTREAESLAKIRGERVSEDGSWIGFRHTKDALDDQIEALKQSGKSPARLRELLKLREDTLGTVENFNPFYAHANAAYHDASKPINAMDVGQYFVDNATSAGQDFARDAAGNVLPTGMGTNFLQNGNWQRIRANPQSAIYSSTGAGGVDDWAKVFQPDQLQTFNAIGDELQTLANLSRDVNGPGSQTMRLLASQNLLRRIGGPMGVPESFLEGTIGDGLAKATNIPYRMLGTNDRLIERAGEVLLDPTAGSKIIAGLRAYEAKQNRPATALERLAKRGTGSAAGMLSAAAVDD